MVCLTLTDCAVEDSVSPNVVIDDVWDDMPSDVVVVVQDSIAHLTT